MTRRAAPRSRFRRVVLGVLGFFLVGVLGYLLIRSGTGPIPDPEGCTATANGRTVSLDLEQAANAALIAGVAVDRGLPARAASIALATAYQESDIRNLDHGDRDSLGLFQQRPSQGWGSPRQIRDPHYAANAFYDELVKIDGYESMEITVAAQEVQRSAFGEAYADHADDARVLASALTGYSQAAFSCVVRHGDSKAAEPRRNGLTPRADRVLDDLRATFGRLPVGGFEPGGVTDGHVEESAHYTGRAIDIFFRPPNDRNQRNGWAVAQYLVARAEVLAVQTVIYDDRIWSADQRSESGWREYDEPDGANRAVLKHRDHVHVDVVEGS